MLGVDYCMCVHRFTTFLPHMHTGQDEAEASRDVVYVYVGSL